MGVRRRTPWVSHVRSYIKIVVRIHNNGPWLLPVLSPVPHNLLDDRYDEASLLQLALYAPCKPSVCVTCLYVPFRLASTFHVTAKQWRRNKRKP